MMKKISFKFWVPFIGACLLILGIFCVIPSLPPLGPGSCSDKTIGSLKTLNIFFSIIENEKFYQKDIFGNKNIQLKEEFFTIMEKYFEYYGYKFHKDHKFDGWGNTIKVDYTTNIIKINYKLSGSDSIFKNKFLNIEHVEEIKHLPIIVWSSGPNGIDERCLGDDIVW